MRLKAFITAVAALALLLTITLTAGACNSPGSYAQPAGYYPAYTPAISQYGIDTYLGCPGCPGCPDGNGTPANPGDPGCLAYGYL
jgi:hypothetical protein